MHLVNMGHDCAMIVKRLHVKVWPLPARPSWCAGSLNYRVRLRPRGERTEDLSFPDCRQIKLDFSGFQLISEQLARQWFLWPNWRVGGFWNFEASFLNTFFHQIDRNPPEISAGKVHEGITFQLSCSDWPEKETASPLDHFVKLFILGCLCSS